MLEMNPFIFREYDIRGVVGSDLSEETVALIGRGFGTFLKNVDVDRISVGGDVRLSSNSIRSNLITALRSTGISIIDLGTVPTPVQYFSMFQLDVQGGAMITGSHNPPDYNGFKLSFDRAPIFGESIQEIREIIQSGKFAKGSGYYESVDLLDSYRAYIKEHISIQRPLKVVLDSGNGAAALVAHQLFRDMGVTTIDLYATPDGRFPNHHPDPTVVDNIQDLIQTVQSNGADFGVGYDGDADRIGVVDENGQVVWGDRLLILFSQEILQKIPGAKIIFEVKCSQALPEMIKKYGGEPVMWKTGHSLLKKKMKETGAPLAGEMSGHLFFADRYFGYDDAIYTSARLAELIASGSMSVSERLADTPNYVSTPEIRAEAVDDAEKFRIADAAKAFFKQNYDVIDIDGVRILFGDGWGLVRASNTQPVLVLRFEARSEQRLNEIQQIVVSKLKEFGQIKI
jgi:phosphomannomutase/phosphoglucomutase